MLGQNYCESVDNPFVYMQAGKFNYQGEEYYLKTCNYLISMFLNDSDELVVAPSTDYFYKWGGGIALPTNQVDADRFLKAHFLALKKMGFNSIRLMGCQVERRWDSDILTTSMYYKNHEAGDNPDPCVNDGEEGVRDWEILTDLESENGKEYYKQAMHVVLEAAEECGIKVIWVMGSERTYVDGNGNESIRSLLTPTGHTINQQFCNFLHDIAIEFRGNSTLIGYDLFNELLSYNGIEGCTTPYELSETVKSLVESIKFVDRNHFITVGHVSIRTFFILGVEPFKHCDVHSFHLYEGEYSDNHIQTNGSEINRQLYYFNKTIDFPWMIGEVGSSTHITEQNPDEDEIAEKELEQRDFALSTLQKSLDCNSLGYSWWQLYDHQYDDKGKWGVLTSDGGYEPVNLDNSGTNTVNIFGEFKKIVDYSGSGENGLSSSVFNIPLTQNECNSLPNAENDPYHYYIYPPIANNTERKHWKGKVLGNGQPLVDAVVKVSVMYPLTNLDDGSSLRDFFTFTKSDGTFDIEIPTDDNTAKITVTKYGYTTSETRNVLNWLSSDNFTLNPYQISTSTLPQKEEYNTDYIVTEGTSGAISQPIMIKGDIIIGYQSELSITSSVYLNENSQLIVKPGGKLILEEGAVLTAIHDSWQGIVMTGNAPESNYTPRLESHGQTCISKANLAISTTFAVSINLNSTNFVNNKHDVRISTNYSGEVVFEKCNFVVKGGAEDNTGYFVSLSGARSNKFIDCNFIDERVYDHEPNKIAIQIPTYSNIDISTGVENCQFKNLAFGVEAYYANVNIEGVDFIDNVHDIKLFYSQGVSIIRRCNFLTVNNAPEDPDHNNWYPYHVKLHICEPVYFYDCDFKDTREIAETKPFKKGIEAWDVEKLKVGPDPQMTARRSTFSNLQYGISSAAETGNSLEVKNTDFDASRGIFATGYSGFGSLKIYNNNFSIKKYYLDIDSQEGQIAQQDDVYQRPFGLYIFGLTNTFKVEGNKYLSDDGDGNLKFGFVARNTGAVTNEFYRNEFVALDNSIQAIGKNGENSIGSNGIGMEFICNNFSNSKTDIFVTPDYSYHSAEISQWQGNPNRPAGNLFTPNASSVSIRNDIYDITYFTRKLDDPNFNAQEIPININEGSALVSVNPIDFEYTDELCPSTTGSTVLPVDHELLREELTISKLTEDALDDMLDDIVDGGNTGQVLSDIIHLEDNSAWITYYELMNKSPYLSDTVLKDIAKKEDVLTVTMIRDILVANPQAAKKSDIKKLLKDRNIQLPDYMIEQIEAGENILSSKEYLEIQKAEQRKRFDRSMMSLVNYYYENSDSLVYAGDSIISLLSLRHEPKYLLLLSEYHASVDDFTSAKDDLSAILSDFEMKDYERDEISNLISYYNHYAEILKVCKGDLLNLDESSIAILKEFAAKDDIASQKATAILLANIAGGFLCPIFEPGMIINPRSARLDNNDGLNEPQFSLYPNPTKEYIYVDYDLSERIGDIKFIIVDVTGRITYEQQLSNLRDVVIVKTDGLIEGTYTCIIYNGPKLEFSTKLVKEK